MSDIDKRKAIPKAQVRSSTIWWLLGRRSDEETEERVYMAVKRAYDALDEENQSQKDEGRANE